MLGARPPGADFLTGSLDEIVLFNRALDTNEIQSVRKATLIRRHGALDNAPEWKTNGNGYALDFNSAAGNYVRAKLIDPPSPNYTIAAWVNVRTGGTYLGRRTGVLSGAACGDSIELLIRAASNISTDPQFLELGRCGSFNGVASTAEIGRAHV